jgi:hypothetical protein
MSTDSGFFLGDRLEAESPGLNFGGLRRSPGMMIANCIIYLFPLLSG